MRTLARAELFEEIQCQPLLRDARILPARLGYVAECLAGSRRWMDLFSWCWHHRPPGGGRESSMGPYQFSSRRPARSCPSSTRGERRRCMIRATSAAAATMRTNAQAISGLVAAAAPTSQFSRPEWVQITGSRLCSNGGTSCSISPINSGGSRNTRTNYGAPGEQLASPGSLRLRAEPTGTGTLPPSGGTWETLNRLDMHHVGGSTALPASSTEVAHGRGLSRL